MKRYVDVQDWGDLCFSSDEDDLGLEYLYNMQGTWIITDEKQFFLCVMKYGIKFKEVFRYEHRDGPFWI